MKRCASCGEEKTLEEFHIDRREPDGKRHSCKSCVNARQSAAKKAMDTPERRAKVAARLYAKNRRKALAVFGLTPEDYESLHIKQNGLCAICCRPESTTRQGKVLLLAVDHCHITGRVRGLLCANCNTGLGKFKDDPGLVLTAYKYLS